MNDYSRIARVIRYLDGEHDGQPSLEELASVTGLSESRFHRLFREWAGLTPKQFLQCLTAEHAKKRLRDSASVLDAALDAGLSGPGRLHGLLVSVEAASPGEYKSGGEGLVIEWGVAESCFGKCCLGWNDRGLCHLVFLDGDEAIDPGIELQRSWPGAGLARTDEGAARQANRIFVHASGRPRGLKAFVCGTPFQLKVWRALVRLPEGSLSSYGALAEAIGHPGGARAVGTACGANPIGYLIPCHRVIRETGVVRGYRWGDVRKRAMLAWEAPGQGAPLEARGELAVPGTVAT